jgi:hypothetical protein
MRACSRRSCRDEAPAPVRKRNRQRLAAHAKTALQVRAHGPAGNAGGFAVYSDRRYHGFMGFAERAIIYAQIKTGFLRFDAGQHHRPAASGAGRPEIVDKLKIQRICHGTDQPVPLLAEQRSLFRGAIGQHQLGKRESDQTRAKQHKTGNGHGEETFRSEFFTHGTPPIVCAPARTGRLSCRTVKGFPSPAPNFHS